MKAWLVHPCCFEAVTGCKYRLGVGAIEKRFQWQKAENPGTKPGGSIKMQSCLTTAKTV